MLGRGAGEGEGVSLCVGGVIFRWCGRGLYYTLYSCDRIIGHYTVQTNSQGVPLLFAD